MQLSQMPGHFLFEPALSIISNSPQYYSLHLSSFFSFHSFFFFFKIFLFSFDQSNIYHIYIFYVLSFVFNFNKRNPFCCWGSSVGGVNI